MSVPEGRPPRSLANFCAQAADLVRVRSLSCTRNTRSRHFDRKTHMFWHNFLQILFRASFGPDASQMPPKCLPDASQMPPRCLSDASRCLQVLPPKTVWGLALG